MEAHTRRMGNLVRSTTEAMKEMIQLLIKENKNSNINVTKEETNKKRQEKKKYNNTRICKHCDKKHPSKAEDECWELEKNNDSQPSTSKTNKSN